MVCDKCGLELRDAEEMVGPDHRKMHSPHYCIGALLSTVRMLVRPLERLTEREDVIKYGALSRGLWGTYQKRLAEAKEALNFAKAIPGLKITTNEKAAAGLAADNRS